MKDDGYDNLGRRMKSYEAAAEAPALDRFLPLYARVDGRHFSNFTRGLGFPYPELKERCGYEMAMAMRKTADALCKEFSAAVVETHSDEISIGWPDLTKVPFDGRYFKLVSNIASVATVHFFNAIRDYIPDKIARGNLPSFDCRVFQPPDEMELVNAFVWRQNDCMRGCLNQYAQQFFSHKELLGKDCRERHAMLLNAGHDYDNNVDSVFRYGYFCEKVTYSMEVPEQYRDRCGSPDGTVLRTKVERKFVDFPLSKLVNKTGFLLRGEKPELKKEAGNGQ